jgi:hypothetical protein
MENLHLHVKILHFEIRSENKFGAEQGTKDKFVVICTFAGGDQYIATQSPGKNRLFSLSFMPNIIENVSYFFRSDFGAGPCLVPLLMSHVHCGVTAPRSTTVELQWACAAYP